MNNNEGFLRLRPCADARVAGLIGVLVGDALGVSFEFKTPSLLPPRDQIEMQPPSGFRKSHAGVPVGTWSDDGAQALCLLASLQECGLFSLTDFSRRLVSWLDDGYMAVDGDVFDCGIQTASAIRRLRDGVPARESGGATERDNGNGSLMRVLPLALWHTGPDDALVGDAHLQSLPTHAHPRSLVACAFYCLTARGYSRKVADPWSWADQRLEEIYRIWPEPHRRNDFLNELDVLRRFGKTDQPCGTGYVLDTIWSARKALKEDSFEDVARTAILFGSDTDTTAAVACGLAGIRFGVDEIPERWLTQLRGFEFAEPLLRKLTGCPRQA
ncbi:ADP-ribosyl-[dinitrogen reductase] hydrolase [Paraburkholderia sp. MM5496-R1]|uniref:ADP-ribosylglycohydrolase family protein n=1 Tax=Paraburkholderia sp. MM5496-R1 TaxID=2991065 RepID=UPI003D1D3C0F